jgi:hypothetical protein
MTANLSPSIFTMEIGGTPTLVFEAQNLREAHELGHEQWLKGDLAEANAMAFHCGTRAPNCAPVRRCPTRAHSLQPKITASPSDGVDAVLPCCIGRRSH